jgi:hypothetical protein
LCAAPGYKLLLKTSTSADSDNAGKFSACFITADMGIPSAMQAAYEFELLSELTDVGAGQHDEGGAEEDDG